VKHLVFFSTNLGINNDTFFLLQYLLPLSLLDNFDNNAKQVIYDLGKYMR
jgi:hypothetical protein